MAVLQVAPPKPAFKAAKKENKKEKKEMSLLDLDDCKSPKKVFSLLLLETWT